MVALRSLIWTKQVQITGRLKSDVGKLLDGGVGDGDLIGWFDADYIYLDPDETRAQVVEFYRRSGEHFATSKNMLHKLLHRAGYIEIDEHGAGERRYDFQVRCEGRITRVLKMQRAKLEIGDLEGGASLFDRAPEPPKPPTGPN